MLKKLIVLLALSGLVSSLLAYPISPRPLRQLVMESEFVIVGYVVGTYKKERDDWGARIAKIVVLENLQGNIERDTIEINFNPNMICPAPDEYFDSTYVLAFVDMDKKTETFTTHALNYGAKTLNLAEIEVYKQRISEIQEILKIDKKKDQFTKTVEWLVTCAEVETTRWEGTYELSPESDFMSYYSNRKKENFKSILNVQQKERLKKALFNTTEYVDFGLVDLVYKDNEASIDDFLISRLKALKDSDYWIADAFMIRLKHRSNSTEMSTVLADFDNLRFESDKKNEQKNTIDKFIKLVEK